MTLAPDPEVERTLRELVAVRLRVDPARIPMDVPIVAGLGLDSMDVMQFLLDVEERFPPFDLSDAEAGGVRTLRELAACVGGLLQRHAGPATG
jgi:acyl carrier protein